MSKVREERSLARVGNGKNGSSTWIAVAEFAMLMTLWVGTARNSAAEGGTRDSLCRFEDLGARR